MNWFGRLVHRRRLESQLEKELRVHIELQIADYVRAGFTPEEAARKAQVLFGGREQIKEECRDARGTMWLESMAQDVVLALRFLRKSPGFTTTAICTLALGIGANTAIFQLLDAVRLRTLPVRDPESLASIQIQGGNHGFGITYNVGMLSYAVWREIRAHQQGFSGVFAWSDGSVGLGSGIEKQPTKALWVSGQTFSTLGLHPVQGRLFTDDNDRPGCGASGVVISYSFWQREFGGRDSAIGSTLVLDDRPTQILGITPARFSGLQVGKDFDLALPLCSLPVYRAGSAALVRGDVSFLTVMGRLRPGWTLARASAQLRSISAAIFNETVPSGYEASALNLYKSFRLEADSAAKGLSALRNSYDSALWLLLGITGLVLLIACTNLANLLLVRATRRQREMAIRLALGASRSRLVRQLLTEGAVLAVTGAMAGVGLARAFSKSIVWCLSTQQDAPYLDLRLDWRVLAFTAIVAVVTCLMFALAPAFRGGRTDAGEVLTSGIRTTAGRKRASLQRGLVAGQIAISLVLVAGAALFVRTFYNLLTLDPGFRESGIIVASVDFSRASVAAQHRREYFKDLLERIRSANGVASAAISTHIPLDGSLWTLGVDVESRRGSSRYTWISPGYFRTMQIALLSGRDLNNRDTASSPPVLIVNRSFVRTYLNGVEPLGQMVRTRAEPNYPATEYEIVGVAQDTKYSSLRDSIRPEAYAPFAQFPAMGPAGNVFIRASGSPAGAISAVKEKLAESSPEIRSTFDIFQTGIRNTLLRERLMAALAGFFGALAAMLAGIGLYGVLSYTVAGCTNEIGIRLALGASRRAIGIGVIRHAVLLVAIGMLIGLPIALTAAYCARSLLFGLPPNDAWTFSAASLFLLAIALLASWIPARRAAGLDPMNALRHE